MFGFGSGCIAPDERTLTKLAKDATRGRAITVPAMTPVKVSASQFKLLKSIPRAGLVTSAEAELGVEILRREPELRVQYLALPASRFVFQMEPIGIDIATVRIVLAQIGQKDGVLHASLTSMSFFPSAGKWLISVAGRFEVLGAFSVKTEVLAAADPSCGLSGIQHEMNLAAAGLLVISQRCAEMLGATRH
jgi:hypothetical protein